VKKRWSSHYLSIQRDPILGECVLKSGKLRVVAGKANLATDALFEGVFSLCTPLSADRLWPVVQRRCVVATEADRDKIVALE
jgi:hypothetical protein